MNKNFKIIQGSKYKALFTYYNVISDKFVRYFVSSVAFCFKTALPGPLLQRRGNKNEDNKAKRDLSKNINSTSFLYACFKLLRGKSRHVRGKLRHITGSSRHLAGESRHIRGKLRHVTGSSRHIRGSSRHFGGRSRDIQLKAFLAFLSKICLQT